MAYPMNQKCRRPVWLLLAAVLCLLWGCAHHQPLPDESRHWLYRADGNGPAMAERWAPAFGDRSGGDRSGGTVPGTVPGRW
jgi:hypothetical protein